MKYKILSALLASSCLILQSCKQAETEDVKFVTLDPGHFHAALVQKTMYDGVSTEVHVYAPDAPDVGFHMNRIEGFNTRDDNPTAWETTVYKGDDFFEKMISEKAGSVVMLSGNNEKKTEYIIESLRAGFNVLADKPMVINAGDFDTLKEAFEVAEKNGVLLYDVMTERHEISTMLQKELSHMPGIFGTLEEGTPGNPAVTKESVHHFNKIVSGSVLTRPPWFFDVTKEGEGIVDVTTHLVDLVQWECFPGEIIDYKNKVELTSAKRWTTDMTLEEFGAVTKLDSFPDYLKKDVGDDGILRVYCNGEINYKINGINAKVSVTWAYKAPPGGRDTHYSIMRGTLANLIIRQGAEQNYKPTLYIEPTGNGDIAKSIDANFAAISAKYPGVKLVGNGDGWIVEIPAEYHIGHEAHFGEVTQDYIGYLKNGDMPAWEVPNMIAKYFITTQALELAKQN